MNPVYSFRVVKGSKNETVSRGLIFDQQDTTKKLFLFLDKRGSIVSSNVMSFDTFCTYCLNSCETVELFKYKSKNI